MHGGRLVARALRNENVPFIFTLCGGHVMPIYDGCIDEGIGVIDVRHEQTAAHAADGWARVTGRPGVAIVTAGPGLTDAVTGVASAHRANIPMLIIGGQGPRPARVGGDDAPIKTVKRDEPKIGRNDPCWCGSGKKYKKCHGAA